MRSANEIRSLTGLRGFAALYVVLFHYFFGVSSTNAITTFLAHGYLAVDLFFVLSGFVMALNYGHLFAAGPSLGAYATFLGRRLARIYPLYLAATVAGFILVVVGGLRYPHDAPLGAALLANVLAVQTWGFVQSFDQPAWSISAESAAYLLFPALVIPTLFRRPITAWVATAVCAATLTALCLLPAALVPGQHGADAPIDFHLPWLALPLLRCVPEFALGLLAYRLATTPLGRALGSSRWLAPSVALLVLALLTLPRTDLAAVLLFPLLTTGLVDARLERWESGPHLIGRLLASAPANILGRLSYSVYLTHELLAAALNWFSTEVRVNAPGIARQENFAVAIGLALTLLTFPIAFLAYKTIEVPGRRWLRAALERRPMGPRASALPSSSVTPEKSAAKRPGIAPLNVR
jgi:peptidoglycan/LPS O-acetylase OafA/YrhL